MRRTTLTTLLAAAVFLLAPAAQAFANGTLTVNIEGIEGGSGEVSSVGGIAPFGGEGEPPIECSGPPKTGSCVDKMEEVEPEVYFSGLHAIPAPGFEVVAWEVEGGLSEGYCPYTFTEDPNDCLVLAFGEEPEPTVTAYFGPEVITFPLTVNKSGTGEGTVTSSPAGIDCGSECEAEFKEGEEVTLTATPEAGSEFSGWSGDCSGTSPCVVTISEAKEVTASFEALPEFPLEITIEGTGSGEVSCQVEGGPTEPCAAEYFEGAEVALVPEAEAGSEFTGWAGDCTGTGACELVIDEAKEVTASFDLEQEALTVQVEGPGKITAPEDIDCPGVCAGSYNFGEEVTLTATPDSQAELVEWTGPSAGSCAGTSTPTCEVEMDEDKTVKAIFAAKPQFLLTVTKAGTGSGTVTSSPAGINCGPVCKAPFVEETEVTLTATAASGSTFTGFSGACSGPEACKVTMSEARSVTATFAANSTPTPTPTPTPAGEGKAKVGAVAKVKGGKAALKLTCTGEGPCKGSLKLSAKLKSGGKLKALTIGKGSFSLAKGAKATLKVKLSGPAKQALAKGPLKAKVKGSGVIASTVKLKA
jgi:Divergent InlB B-repeat domain